MSFHDNVNWTVPSDYTHGLHKIVERALLMGYKPNEIHEIRELYVFSLGYFARNVPKPKDYKHFMSWRDARNYEAFTLCDLAIQRTVDLWHIEMRKEKEPKEEKR